MELFYLSREKESIDLKPIIPSNYYVKYNYADNKTKRITFHTSIEGALRVKGKLMEGEKYFIHVPKKINLNKLKTTEDIKTLSPTAEISDEVWYLEEISTSVIGKVDIGKIKPDSEIVIYYNKEKNLRATYHDWEFEVSKNLADIQTLSKAEITFNEAKTILEDYHIHKQENKLEIINEINDLVSELL